MIAVIAFFKYSFLLEYSMIKYLNKQYDKLRQRERRKIWKGAEEKERRITRVSDGDHLPVDKKGIPGLEKPRKHIKLKHWNLKVIVAEIT